MARPHAFDELCREHSADLVHFATLVRGDRGKGEDLAQDALLEVWRRWGMLDLADPDAYLHTVVIRRHHRGLQRLWNREHPTRDVPEPNRAVVDAADGVVERDRLLRALATLPDRQREAVVLCHVVDHPTAVAAEVLGCSPAAVRSLCDRGLRALRTQLSLEDSHDR